MRIKNIFLSYRSKAQVGEKDKIDILGERDSSQSKILGVEKIKKSGIVNILTKSERY